jgi:hypothetical protein
MNLKLSGTDLFVVSVSASYANLTDVKIVQNTKCIDISAAATGTKIMFGDSVATKMVDSLPVNLQGTAVNKHCIMAYTAVGPNGVAGGTTVYLIQYTSYRIDDDPNSTAHDIIYFDSGAVCYRWDEDDKAFKPFESSTKTFRVQVGPPVLLDGLLVNLVDASIDVDEDGPYMQRAVPNVGFIHFTQYSVYRETITMRYSASMIASTDCDAVPIQLEGGKVSAEKYKELTTSQGLYYLNNLRSVRRADSNYAPPGVCNKVTQMRPVVKSVVGQTLVVEWEEASGKESNYSLSNLVKRTEFWQEGIEDLSKGVRLMFSCGELVYAYQYGGSGTKYKLFPISVPDGTNWQGVLTTTAPRITCYTPRFTHVQYDAASHTLHWQEQFVNSYVLFNNFKPDGFDLGMAPFGAGGPFTEAVFFDGAETPPDQPPWYEPPET